MGLNIISFNCRSANSNLEIIRLLMNECDILFLQETLLSENNHYILGNLGAGFNYAHTPATRSHDNFCGRSSGGLALLWKKVNNLKFYPIHFTNRIMGLRIDSGTARYLLVNVYAPCDYRKEESLMEYRSVLADLSNILLETDFDQVVLSGDWNADPAKGRFYKELSAFVSTFSLSLVDVGALPADSFSYVSGNGSLGTSWIDHTISSDGFVDKCKILYGYTFEDHIPISFQIFTSVVPDIQVNLIDENSIDESLYFVRWDRATDDDRLNYVLYLDELVEGFQTDALSCNEGYCSLVGHRELISASLQLLKHFVRVAAELALPCVRKDHSCKVVPGWNDYCKDLYREGRRCFMAWCNMGRPRTGMIFDSMKLSRSNFKSALNFCKKNELNIRRKKLIDSFRDKNKSNFWKNVRNLSKKVVSSNIDGLNNNEDITKMFTEKYHKILDDPMCNLVEDNPDGGQDVDHDGLFHVFFRDYTIDNSIDKLNPGIDWEFFHANHLKWSGPKFRSLLGKLFKCMLIHSYVPDEMLVGAINPRLKNGKIIRTDSDNFRPVMNSSMFLKVFEHCIKPDTVKYLNINGLQFGFTPGSGPLDAVSFVKETILKYKFDNSNVFCAALDLSRAFDRVNITKLLKKIYDTKIPGSIKKILKYILEHTYVKVLYGDCTGDIFLAKNGLRQGGILSTVLFNFYINEVIESVTEMDVGCKLEFDSANIIGYADDLILLAPTARALQQMLHIIGPILNNLAMKVNVEKSSWMLFRPNAKINICGTRLELMGMQLPRVSVMKYLGIFLREDFLLTDDIDRVLKSFLCQFNSMLGKFSFMKKEVLYFLFKTYCTSFYGMETWIERRIKNAHIRQLAVSYHKAVKRISGLKSWDGNHVACEMVEVNLLQHLLMKRMVRHFFGLISSNFVTMRRLRNFFLWKSHTKRVIEEKFREDYELMNFASNDVDALMARVDFVQRTEPRSNYVYSA